MSSSEIGARFRKSELFLYGWRSREQSSFFNKKFKKVKTLPQQEPSSEVPSYEGMPESVLTDGQPDISKMTSNQALKFLHGVGIKIPIIRR